MITNVLVTGANGQLAQTIKELHQENDYRVKYTFVSKKELDITDFDAVSSFFSKNSFNYCINCAAYTNVEQAEESIDLAFQINAEAVKNIATVCKEYNITLIHISTDYVFDGEKTTPYIETDETNPINQYGKSKLKGELYIKDILNEYYIIRTSWLYSAYGKNFVKTIFNKIKENADLKITTEETGTPTSCADLSEIIYKLIIKKVTYGTYHFSNQGEATWYEFAKEIAAQFLAYDENKVSSVPSFKTKAKRPKYSVLNKSKILLATKAKNKSWKESLSKIMNILKKER